MKPLFVLTCIGALLAGTPVSAADDVDTSKLPPASSKTGLTYEKDIKPLVEASCLKCHSGQRPKSRYSMESLEGIIKGGSSDEAAIIKGDSAKSPFVWYAAELVVEMEMPPLDKREDFPAWTKEEIGLVRAWIDQGAK